jgi:hypothetical protein
MAPLLLLLLLCAAATAARPSFVIANDSFVQDGKPVRLVNACMHYARVRSVFRKRR